ncbi:hypothetical protein Tco_0513469 [Tanacetum coccineum]
MFAALYDDRSIRAHVHHTRELLSLSTLHSSLSTLLALQHESNQNAASKSGALASIMVYLQPFSMLPNLIVKRMHHTISLKFQADPLPFLNNITAIANDSKATKVSHDLFTEKFEGDKFVDSTDIGELLNEFE